MKKYGLFILLCLFLGMGSAMAEDSWLQLSAESGVYARPFYLEVQCSLSQAEIHYTLDGSAPTLSSPLYTAPLYLDRTVGRYDPLSHIQGLHIENDYSPITDFPSAHVVRMAVIQPDGTIAATAEGTFFVGYRSREDLFGPLPIISLMMNKDDLFDYETGIFMLGESYEEWAEKQTEAYEAWEVYGNFSNKGREWERPVTVDFMMSPDEHFTQVMGVRIKGAASRTAPQKSLRLIARDDYGKKNITYPLLPDNICEADGTVLAKYKSITLRNGANDRDNARIRDPYVSFLARELNMETAMSRPVVCFINGEYWGVYTLTEEFSDHHLANHYGLKDENIITIKKSKVEDGTEEDENLFWDMYRFITENDMADAALYQTATELVDIKSMADYAAVTLYIANEDGIFHYNNWMMWRVRQPERNTHPYADGRWRMVLYDSDYSSDVYGDGNAYGINTIKNLLFQEYEAWHPARMITSLMKNEHFRREMVLSLCDVRNLSFEKNRALALADEMAREYASQTNQTFLRFGPDWVVKWNMDSHYQNRLNTLKTFFAGRYTAFSYHIQSAFRLSRYAEIRLSSTAPEMGCILVNERNIPVTSLQVHYFPEYPITLTAQPEEGCVFKEWRVVKGENVVLSHPGNITTQLSFQGDCAIEAVFESFHH